MRLIVEFYLHDIFLIIHKVVRKKPEYAKHDTNNNNNN